ncbi:MAG: hypothetical protein R2795_10945 [Saprospiraceae bacterium]
MNATIMLRPFNEEFVSVWQRYFCLQGEKHRQTWFSVYLLSCILVADSRDDEAFFT